MRRRMQNETCSPQESESVNLIRIGGIYKHYSGKRYKIMAIGHGSEDLRQYVVYQGLYNDPKFGDQPIWIRPLEMFVEVIDYNGKKTQRFELIEE